MIGIKYFALDENEEVPYEFVVTRNVNGEPEFCASFVNTNTLAYGNGVLLKLHQRNDELRAENAKLREFATEIMSLTKYGDLDCGLCKHYDECWAGEAMNFSPTGCIICNEARELGIEVEE